MKKIPVGATIAHAYRFAFFEFFNLLRLTWVPLAAATAVGFAVRPQMAAFVQAMATHDFSAVPAATWPILALVYVISIGALFLQLTAILQYALGQIEARGRWYYIAWGKPALRLLGAIVLLVLTLAGLLIAYGIAILVLLFVFRFGLAASNISADAIKSIAAFDTALAFLIGYFGFIFCTVRFGFLLPAATIAEGRIALKRSWALSHGNFWRIFVVMLAIFVPLCIVELGGLYAAGMMHLPPMGAVPDQVRALQQQQTLAATLAMQKYWYATTPLTFLITTFFNGLVIGAQSLAYRTLAYGPALPTAQL